jgi:hypothetical protein
MKLHCCILILFVSDIFCQNVLQLKGKIIDSKQSVLAYCPLQINSISTLSNENGEFEFNIPISSINDTIRISYVGFYNKKIPANELYKTKYNLIVLTEHIYNLKEIIVEPKISADLVINNIILNFNKNYRISSYNLTGFFRNYVKENNKYDKLIEGEVNIHSKGFNLDLKNLSKSAIHLTECRTSYSSGIHQEVNTINNFNALFSSSENLHKILLNKKYSFFVDKYEFIDKDKLIYLSFNRNEKSHNLYYDGYFVINSSNWGIEKIAYFTHSKKDSTNQYKQSFVDSIKLKYIDKNLYVNFLLIDNHYELSYLRMEYNNELISPNTKIIVSTTTEYLTNDFNSRSRKKGKKLIENGTLIKQTYNMSYHPKFWSKYNYLLENSELEQVKKDINEAKFNN